MNTNAHTSNPETTASIANKPKHAFTIDNTSAAVKNLSMDFCKRILTRLHPITHTNNHPYRIPRQKHVYTRTQTNQPQTIPTPHPITDLDIRHNTPSHHPSDLHDLHPTH